VTTHSLTHNEARRTSVHRAGRKGPLQLGWPHFWLLVSTLGGILALIALVVAFAYQ
jgi:hypothetical protein